MPKADCGALVSAPVIPALERKETDGWQRWLEARAATKEGICRLRQRHGREAGEVTAS